jgi:hypothetical protein
MNIVNFDELGIEPPSTAFVGKKIDVQDILNTAIVIYDYKIVPSKYPKDAHPNRLDLQIEYDGEKRVAWTCSNVLMDMIQKVPKDKFPFAVKIIKEKDSKRLIFTKP